MIKLIQYCPVIMTVLIILSSCAHVKFGGERGTQRKNNFAGLLADCSDRADTLYLRDMDALFRIIDEHFHRQLRRAPDRAVFENRITAYKAQQDYQTRPDTPSRNEWWDEIMTRVAYCRERYPTTIRAIWRDARWELVIQLGIPSNERVIEMGCWKGSGRSSLIKCDVYILTWDSLNTELACQGLQGNRFPDRIIPWEDEFTPLRPTLATLSKFRREVVEVVGTEPEFNPFPELKREINAHITFASFPDPDHNFSFWVSTLARGDQFERATGGGTFHAELVVYDSARAVVYGDTSVPIDLTLPDSVADAKEVGYFVYLGGKPLPTGDYEAIITIIEDGTHNMAVYRGNFKLPSPQAAAGFSDLLLTLKPGMERGEAIGRGEKNLWGNPIPAYHRGDTLFPYLELELPHRPHLPDEYDIAATLIRIPRRKSFAKPVVSPGEILEVYDTLGQPFSHDTREQVAEWGREIVNNKQGIEIFSGIYRSDRPSLVIHPGIAIPSDLAKGKYFLVVAVRDVSGGRYYGRSWQEIEIK